MQVLLLLLAPLLLLPATESTADGSCLGRAELGELPLSALIRRAKQAADIDPAALESALDSPSPRAAIITLLHRRQKCAARGEKQSHTAQRTPKPKKPRQEARGRDPGKPKPSVRPPSIIAKFRSLLEQLPDSASCLRGIYCVVGCLFLLALYNLHVAIAAAPGLVECAATLQHVHCARIESAISPAVATQARCAQDGGPRSFAGQSKGSDR
jgi:hypothetical protein